MDGEGGKEWGIGVDGGEFGIIWGGWVIDFGRGVISLFFFV